MDTGLFLVDFIFPQVNIQSAISHQKLVALATERELFGELRNMNGGEEYAENHERSISCPTLHYWTVHRPDRQQRPKGVRG